MTRNIANDGQYQLLYDAENRVVEVKKNGATIAQFTYDGDGKRVKSVEGGVTILFVGGHYEVKGSEITKYYFAGAARIATPALAPGASVRKYTIPVSSTLEFILGDHLGSTSFTVDSTGAKTSEMRYKPWGEVRGIYPRRGRGRKTCSPACRAARCARRRRPANTSVTLGNPLAAAYLRPPGS